MRASPSSASPQASHSSSALHHLVFLDELAVSSDRAGPSILSGAPADDRMSIATSEGELGSGDDDSAALPPSGRVALPESDPGLTAMLSRAAESVGLHWRPPPSPECSRLDDWFLGAQADHRQSPQVSFFPEVHEEVTSSWRAPFSARNRASAFSVLTALDGGVAKGVQGSWVLVRFNGRGLHSCWTGRLCPARHGPPANLPGQGVEAAVRGQF